MKAIFLFLINPIAGLWYALLDLNKRWHGLVFVAFYSLFGFALSFTLTSADSYRIAARFCQQDYVFQNIWGMYERGTITDIYMLSVFSLVKPYTDNPKVVFAVMGAVLGGLAYLSVSQMFKIWNGKRTKYFYLILCFFVLVFSFDKVNAIRFWTATAYFSFFAIQYLYFKRRIALFLVVLSPLFHFAYMIGVVGFYLFVLLRLLRVTTNMFYFMFVIMFVGNIFMPSNMIDDMMTDEEGEMEEISDNRAIGRKEQRYMRIDVNQKRHDEKVKKNTTSLYSQANQAFTRTFGYIHKYGMFLMLSILYFNRKRTTQGEGQRMFFRFVLFSYIVGYTAQIVVFNGGRFLVLANHFYIFWFFSVFQQNCSRRWRQYAWLLVPLNFYALSFVIFNAPRLVAPMFWVAPPVLTIMDGIGFAPVDFVG